MILILRFLWGWTTAARPTVTGLTNGQKKNLTIFSTLIKHECD